MTMIETVGAMAPGVVGGVVVGVIMRMTGRKPGSMIALEIIIGGVGVWAVLDHFGQYHASAVLSGALFGWMVGAGGWPLFGRGGWWRRDDGDEPGPFGPGPEGHTVDPLWAEFEATPAFGREKSNTQ